MGGSAKVWGVDMNAKFVRVWFGDGLSLYKLDFELPQGARPKHWTVLRHFVPRHTPPRSRKKGAGKP